MKKQTGESLLEKLKGGKITAEEMLLLEAWYADYADTAKPLEHVEVYVTAMKKMDADFPFTPGAKPMQIWKKVSVAAAIVLIVGSGLFYSSLRNNSFRKNQSTFKSEIDPGHYGATLTLSNGKKIRLSDLSEGETVQQAGTKVTKTSDGQLAYQQTENFNGTGKTNTLATAKGETYLLILPDKSKVWLNAASSLTYTTNLNVDGKRKVRLEGEGYFEITPDKSHPFVVESKGQKVEVLGTHFNINAYGDESSETTTLLEGSVRIVTGANKKEIKPGEQALNNGSSIKVVQNNVENAIDWKKGEFYLDNINFKTAMRKIARWYDVDIVYNSPVPDDMQIGGWISRNEKLSSVLRSIESAGLVRFEVEGRKIYVTK